MSAQLKNKTKPETTTITVRLPLTSKRELEELSELTKRSKSFLAGHAIQTYVAQELEICRGIQRGIEDFENGRTVSHAEAMKRLYKAARGE